MKHSIITEYEDYILTHVNDVVRAYYWLLSKFPNLFLGLDIDALTMQVESHDSSKWGTDEFYPYAEYFYGDSKTDRVKDAFNEAWLHHLHNNPHHWQHWVLINDDDGTQALPMPITDIIEMICDHWSFSWKTGNLYEIFKWYDEHKATMILHDDTREFYESTLDMIKEVLDKEGSNGS